MSARDALYLFSSCERVFIMIWPDVKGRMLITAGPIHGHHRAVRSHGPADDVSGALAWLPLDKK
jgi:hypothetical protein